MPSDAAASPAGASLLPNFANLGDLTRSTPTSGYGVRYIAHRKHWHITLNGVDQSDLEPCFNEVNDALDRADVLNGASSGSTGAPEQEDREKLWTLFAMKAGWVEPSAFADDVLKALGRV